MPQPEKNDGSPYASTRENERESTRSEELSEKVGVRAMGSETRAALVRGAIPESRRVERKHPPAPAYGRPRRAARRGPAKSRAGRPCAERRTCRSPEFWHRDASAPGSEACSPRGQSQSERAPELKCGTFSRGNHTAGWEGLSTVAKRRQNAQYLTVLLSSEFGLIQVRIRPCRQNTCSEVRK